MACEGVRVWGIWDVGCGMWGVGCGVWGWGVGMRGVIGSRGRRRKCKRVGVAVEEGERGS